ncbi:MAG: cytochrome b [Armatimonadota bacterium]
MWSRFKAWFQSQKEIERWLRILSPALLYSALDERLTIGDALKKALKKPVGDSALGLTWCLGGTALLLFINQVITGVLLAVYYQPSQEAAYASVRFIEQQVSLGWLIRQMHAWGANLMVVFVMAHMVKVFFNKAYRPPRELTWVSGTLLLFVTLGFGFSGYLLPWDQLSYWASMVGTSLTEAVPWLGHYILVLLRGGENLSGLTISRFFALHVIVLPWVAGILLIGHFMIVRRLGISKSL